jgi:hypothetical protein
MLMATTIFCPHVLPLQLVHSLTHTGGLTRTDDLALMTSHLCTDLQGG